MVREMAEGIKIGYARVSSKDQNEARQIKTLAEAGVEERYIFIDKESGKNYERDSYQAMLKVVRKGDTVFVPSLDRLGRNYTETGKQWETITKEIGADIVVLDMDILDTRKSKDLTGTFIADLVIKILSYVAEKERESIKQRQREGIDIAKAEGKYQGRKPVEVNKALFEVTLSEVRAGDRTNRSAMKKLGLKPNTYYKVMKEFDTKTGRWA
jgi:DNA invertase Pin-like site-specific DNA recombinase